MPPRSCSRARHGSTLLIVVGLLVILIGLIAAVALRMRNTLADVGVFQRSVQSYLMLEAAKLVIQGRSDGGTLRAAAITAGGQNNLPALGRMFANNLGWGHIVPSTTAPTTTFTVIADGGGAIQAGLPLANAYEVKFAYTVTFNSATAAATRFTVTVQPAQAVYPW